MSALLPLWFKFIPHAQAQKKLTGAQRSARKRRKKETEIIFINGKQKRIKREPTLDGMKHF